MSYDVLHYFNIDDLIEQVNRAIERGWSLRGGLIHSQGQFFQAMVWKETDERVEMVAG
jgi:hypothetical protein